MKVLPRSQYTPRFPDRFYPNIAEIPLFRGDEAATDLASLVVMLAIDQRERRWLQLNPVGYLLGRRYARLASASANQFGFEASAHFIEESLPNETASIRFALRPRGNAGLITTTESRLRPSGQSQKYWIRSQSGQLDPQIIVPESTAETGPMPLGLHEHATHYRGLTASIIERDSPLPLQLVGTSFTAYHSPPPPDHSVRIIDLPRQA